METKFRSTTDTSSVVVVKYAKHFTVAYHENYKIVTTTALLNNWWNARSVMDTTVTVLVQKGSPMPVLEGNLKKATVVEVPVESVALNIQSGESFLELLGLLQHLVAYGRYVSYNDSIRDKTEKGVISEIDYRWSDAPALHIVKERGADVFFMRILSPDDRKILQKCLDMNINAVPDMGWAEEHYMGRAEWIKYYALFFNAEAQANDVFNQIERNIEGIKEKLLQVEERPSAIWTRYVGNGRWFVHRNDTDATLLEDAGILNVLKSDSASDTENMNLSNDELVDRGRHAKIWILGDAQSVVFPVGQDFSAMEAWKTNNLYHTVKSYKPETEAFDWSGMGVARPDWVLADLLKIAHPETSDSSETRFIGRYDKEKILLPHQGRNSRVMGTERH